MDFLLGLSILKDCFWLDFGASKVEKAFFRMYLFYAAQFIIMQDGERRVTTSVGVRAQDLGDLWDCWCRLQSCS